MSFVDLSVAHIYPEMQSMSVQSERNIQMLQSRKQALLANLRQGTIADPAQVQVEINAINHQLAKESAELQKASDPNFWSVPKMDSGLGSVYTTRPSSATHMEEDILQSWEFQWELNQGPDPTGDHFVTTRGQRIRESLFPETLDDGAQGGMATLESSSCSKAMQALFPPAQQIKESVKDLINYQDDAEVGTKAISYVLKVFRDGNVQDIANGAHLIHELSKKEASRAAIIKCPEIVKALVQLLQASGDSATLSNCVQALQNLSLDRLGLQAIHNVEGIPALVRMLTYNVESIVFYAITTLHNLILYSERAKQEVRGCSGLEKMANLLTWKSCKFLAILTDCLHMLSYGNQESRLVLGTCHVGSHLLRIISTTDYEKLQFTTSRLLRGLSICPMNKGLLLDANTVGVLTRLIGGGGNVPVGDKVLRNLLQTLMNLSDCANERSGSEPLIQRLLPYLGSDDANIVLCVAGTISNLTCKNVQNKQEVVRISGVPILLQVLAKWNTRVDIVDPLVCALRHVTVRHPLADTARKAVREFKGIPQIVGLLGYPHGQVVKATLGLLRNLGYELENQTVIAQVGGLTRLVQILRKYLTESQPGQKVDDVSIEDILEGAAGALYHVARNPENKNVLIRGMSCVPDFVQLLRTYSKHGPVVLVCLGALCELSTDAQAAQVMIAQDAIPLIQRLVEIHGAEKNIIFEYANRTLANLMGKSVPGVRPTYLDTFEPSTVIGADMVPSGMFPESLVSPRPGLSPSGGAHHPYNQFSQGVGYGLDVGYVGGGSGGMYSNPPGMAALPHPMVGGSVGPQNYAPNQVATATMGQGLHCMMNMPQQQQSMLGSLPLAPPNVVAGSYGSPSMYLGGGLGSRQPPTQAQMAAGGMFMMDGMPHGIVGGFNGGGGNGHFQGQWS